MKVYRQGDVAFILREKDSPKGAAERILKIAENEIGQTKKTVKILKTRVVRRGENGGVHQLEKKQDVVFYEDEKGTRFAIAPTGVSILGKGQEGGHHEHEEVRLEPGVYELRVQSEQRGQFRNYVVD